MAGIRADEYVFGTADAAERRRPVDRTALWDPFTLRRLDEVGVGRGWRCGGRRDGGGPAGGRRP